MLAALHYDITRQSHCNVGEEGLHNVVVTKYLNIYLFIFDVLQCIYVRMSNFLQWFVTFPP
jgi:hypothetical protein